MIYQLGVSSCSALHNSRISKKVRGQLHFADVSVLWDRGAPGSNDVFDM